MVSQLRSLSWSRLELTDSQPDDLVISDTQILRALRALRRYALDDECSCPVDEGHAPRVQCAYCEAVYLLHEVTGAFV